MSCDRRWDPCHLRDSSSSTSTISANSLPRRHTRYFEAFNRSNVALVDLHKTPIQRVTETGVRTTNADLEFDMIVYATGFDAVTGSCACFVNVLPTLTDCIIVDAIDIRGVNGIRLRDEWTEGPRTYLGFTAQHFPNMFMVMGPHQAYGTLAKFRDRAPSIVY